MRTFAEGLHALAVAAWAGSLWSVGLLVAPVLFAIIEDRSLAGRVAGSLFHYAAWIGLACAAWILLFRIARFGGSAFRQAATWTVLLLAALVALGEFGVQPVLSALREQALSREIAESVFRQRFATWHGVASVLYLVQCAVAVALRFPQASNGAPCWAPPPRKSTWSAMRMKATRAPSPTA